MMLNIKEFHESTSKELDVIKNRVRNLIGSANWGEEGRYKEFILRNVIRRFLPAKYSMGTGFVVKRQNRDVAHETSKQIDLIIYDTSFPLLFSEGDFVIIPPESVRGIIEVKANLQNQNQKEIIDKMNETGRFIFEGKKNKNKPIFNGIFSYEGFDNITDCPQNIRNCVRNFIDNPERNAAKFYTVNHISLNKKLFLKYWQIDNKFSLYKLENLSFSYFISNLIYFVTEEYIEHESNLWFPGDKTPYKICDDF
jgi:hypothetical protein